MLKTYYLGLQWYIMRFLCPHYYRVLLDRNAEIIENSTTIRQLDERIEELEEDVHGAVHASQHWQKLARRRLDEIYELKLKKKKTTKKRTKK